MNLNAQYDSIAVVITDEIDNYTDKYTSKVASEVQSITKSKAAITKANNLRQSLDSYSMYFSNVRNEDNWDFKTKMIKLQTAAIQNKMNSKSLYKLKEAEENGNRRTWVPITDTYVSSAVQDELSSFNGTDFRSSILDVDVTEAPLDLFASSNNFQNNHHIGIHTNSLGMTRLFNHKPSQKQFGLETHMAQQYVDKILIKIQDQNEMTSRNRKIESLQQVLTFGLQNGKEKSKRILGGLPTDEDYISDEFDLEVDQKIKIKGPIQNRALNHDKRIEKSASFSQNSQFAEEACPRAKFSSPNHTVIEELKSNLKQGYLKADTKKSGVNQSVFMNEDFINRIWTPGNDLGSEPYRKRTFCKVKAVSQAAPSVTMQTQKHDFDESISEICVDLRSENSKTAQQEMEKFIKSDIKSKKFDLNKIKVQNSKKVMIQNMHEPTNL